MQREASLSLPFNRLAINVNIVTFVSREECMIWTVDIE